MQVENFDLSKTIVASASQFSKAAIGDRSGKKHAQICATGSNNVEEFMNYTRV